METSIRVRDGIGSRCEPGCDAPVGAQCHCTVCHRTFSAITNFDRHRRDGWCLDPGSVGLVVTARGVWKMPPDPDRPSWRVDPAVEAVDRVPGGTGRREGPFPAPYLESEGLAPSVEG